MIWRWLRRLLGLAAPPPVEPPAPPPPLPAEPYPATDDEIDTAARTLFGEARGESIDGKIAVVWTIRNRAEQGGWWGDSIGTVCLKPWQFSCWLPSDPNRAKLLALPRSDRRYKGCRRIVEEVLAGEHADPTHSSTHYCHVSITPAWAEGLEPVVVIGRHKFFRDVG